MPLTAATTTHADTLDGLRTGADNTAEAVDEIARNLFDMAARARRPLIRKLTAAGLAEDAAEAAVGHLCRAMIDAAHAARTAGQEIDAVRYAVDNVIATANDQAGVKIDGSFPTGLS